MIKDLLEPIEQKEKWSQLVLDNLLFHSIDTKRGVLVDAECIISEYNRDCKIFIRKVAKALEKFQDEKNMSIELQKEIKKQYTDLVR